MRKWGIERKGKKGEKEKRRKERKRKRVGRSEGGGKQRGREGDRKKRGREAGRMEREAILLLPFFFSKSCQLSGFVSSDESKSYRQEKEEKLMISLVLVSLL